MPKLNRSNHGLLRRQNDTVGFNELHGFFRAIVEDNRDPFQVGRIKARIYPIHGEPERLPTEELPWCNPVWPFPGGHAPPEIGRRIWVSFENGEIDKPAYFGYWHGVHAIPMTEQGALSPSGLEEIGAYGEFCKEGIVDPNPCVNDLQGGWNGSATDASYLQYLMCLEQKYGLPPGTLYGVMMQESGGNPEAVSPAGAQGLFQFMPGTAAEYGINPYDPNEAADGAAQYLSKYYHQTGSIDQALIAYNAGPGRIGSTSLPSETVNYIPGVKSKMQQAPYVTNPEDFESCEDQECVEAMANPTGSTASGLPADGQITGEYGEQRSGYTHKGIDIAVPVGTPVQVTGSGTVVRSGWSSSYGNVVYVDHGNGVQTRYAHNSQNLVSVGQTVEQGQVIAYSGNTGRSTGPHIHYEKRVDGQAVDPLA